MRRGRGRETILTALGAMYARGAAIDWRAALPREARRIPLPSYPWSRTRYWRPSLRAGDAARSSTETVHPIEPAASAVAATSMATEPVARFVDSLAAAPPKSRELLLLAHVREQIGGVIGLAAAQIDPAAPLGELGLDSMMSVELKNRLERSLGLSLSATLVWSHPTTAALVRHLAQKLGPSPGDPSRGDAADSTADRGAPAAPAVKGKVIDALDKLRALRAKSAPRSAGSSS
jgi:acyl transferase domain-containing protein